MAQNRINDHPAPSIEDEIDENNMKANDSHSSNISEELSPNEINENKLIFDQRRIKNRLRHNSYANKNTINNLITDKHAKGNAKSRKNSQLRTPSKKSFQCDICMQKFGTKGALKTHIIYQHTEDGTRKDYKCSKCSYRTSRQAYLTIHLNTHVSIMRFECAACLKKFKSKGTIRLHIQTFHVKGTEKKYDCPHCSYRTHHKSDLQKHIGKHTKSFHCNVCVASFTNETSLKRHVEWRHTDHGIKKRYKCPECSYQSNHGNTLKKHLNVHKLRSFQCHICGNKFSRKDSIKRHIAMIHQVVNKNYVTQRYVCDICLAKFDDKDNLKTHVQSEHF